MVREWFSTGSVNTTKVRVNFLIAHAINSRLSLPMAPVHKLWVNISLLASILIDLHFQQASTGYKSVNITSSSTRVDAFFYHRQKQQILQASICKHIFHTLAVIKTVPWEECIRAMEQCPWETYPGAQSPGSSERAAMLHHWDHIHGNADETQCYGRHSPRCALTLGFSFLQVVTPFTSLAMDSIRYCLRPHRRSFIQMLIVSWLRMSLVVSDS